MTREGNEAKMTRSQLKRTALLLVVALLVLGSVGAALAGGPEPRPGQARFEIGFMTDMIDHHAMAVEEATLCLEKATHAELLAMCQAIVTTQAQEVTVMQTWLGDWYGLAHDPQMSEEDRMMLEQMAALSGPDFEMHFMAMMIDHHGQAVKEGSKCERRAYHDELAGMCTDIVRSQAQEISMLQSWLCDWYGMCDHRHMKM